MNSAKSIIILLFYFISACAQNKKSNDNLKQKEESCKTFQISNIDSLIKNSNEIYSERWDDENLFILSDVLFLTLDNKTNKISYLYQLPKTTEDDDLFIQLIIQDLDSNKLTIVKDWVIDSSNENRICGFFESKKEDILNHLKNNKLKYNEENIEIIREEKNDFLINKLINDIDKLKFFKYEILGKVKNSLNFESIYLIGLLEKVDHSPNALHLRFVSLNNLQNKLKTNQINEKLIGQYEFDNNNLEQGYESHTINLNNNGSYIYFGVLPACKVHLIPKKTSEKETLFYLNYTTDNNYYCPFIEKIKPGDYIFKIIEKDKKLYINSPYLKLWNDNTTEFFFNKDIELRKI
jgi:hypothetical protein